MQYQVLLVVSALVLACLTTSGTFAVEDCEASWYEKGHTTASGLPFNPGDARIAAHKSLPFGTEVLVTNLENGKQLRTVIRDRGPFVAGRCIDVTRVGADTLGFRDAGVTNVRVTVPD